MAQRTLTENAQSPYVRWEVPGLPRMIFRRGVVDAIDTEVMRAFNAVPKRGAEVGGILLGSRTETEVLVDDFEPVPCEHRFGPSYQLSDADSAALEETLVHFRTERLHAVSVVGLYRSHTRADFSLGPEDVELFTKHFNDPSQVFLLIKPNRSQTSVADFFFWRQKELRQALHVVPFPFRESATSPARRLQAVADIAPAVAPAVTAAPPVPVARETPALPPKTRAAGAGEAVASVAAPAPPPVPQVIKPAAAPVPPPAKPVAAPRLPPKPIGTAWPYDDARRPRNYWLWGTVAAVVAIIGVALQYRSLHEHAAAPVKTPVRQEAAATEPSPPEQTTPAQPAAATAAKTPEPVAAQPAAEPNVPPGETPANDAIRVMLDRWAGAIRQGDVESAAHYYSPHMTTYLGTSRPRLTDVRGRLLYQRGRYGKLAINRISDLSITPQGRDTAVAAFHRHWQTTGRKMTTGEARVRMTLVRTASGWRIASEQETRVY